MPEFFDSNKIIFVDASNNYDKSWAEIVDDQNTQKEAWTEAAGECDPTDNSCLNLTGLQTTYYNDQTNKLLTYTGCDGGPDIYSDYPLHSQENDYVRIGCEWYTYDSTIFGTEVTDLVNYIEQWQGAAPADCTAANLYSTIKWRKCDDLAAFVYTDCFVDGFPGYVIEELHDLASNPIAGCWELIGSSNVPVDALIPEPMVQTACELC